MGDNKWLLVVGVICVLVGLANMASNMSNTEDLEPKRMIETNCPECDAKIFMVLEGK